MSSRRSKQDEQPLPPLLMRVIASARAVGEPGHAEALEAYGQLALIEVPRRGVLSREDSRAAQAIEDIAREHLGLSDSRTQFRTALASVEPFAQRDAIETAHNLHELLSERSYYYVGLAYGITLATLADHR